MFSTRLFLRLQNSLKNNNFRLINTLNSGNQIKNHCSLLFHENIDKRKCLNPFIANYDVENVNCMENLYFNEFTLSLHIKECNMNDKNMETLRERLEECQYISYFSIVNPKNVESKITNLFNDITKRQRNLSNLLINGLSLNDELTKSMFNLIGSNNVKKTIGLIGMDFSSINHNDLMSKLYQSKDNLEDLRINWSNIEQKFVIDLASLLKFCPKLRKLALNGNTNIGESLNNLLHQLEGRLETLHLSDCKFNKDKTEMLGKSLSNLKSLKSIDLSGNTQMGDGFKEVCYGLIDSNNLETITLNGCYLNDKQANWLSELIYHNKNVKSIKIYENPEIDTAWKNLPNELFEGRVITAYIPNESGKENWPKDSWTRINSKNVKVLDSCK